MELHDEVLVALRQIIRSIDLYSKKIKREYGLTGPQLLLLRAIQHSNDMTIRQLSDVSNMSPATATSILDRLELRGFIERVRDKHDKRKVHAQLTQDGQTILEAAPQMMQQDAIAQFDALESWEQNLILSSLQRLAVMMNSQSEPEHKSSTSLVEDPLLLMFDQTENHNK
jgi:DNA-binding MarR family transcriptional regulator